jgi:hypothetical protein
VLFDLERAQDVTALEALLAAEPALTVVDTIDGQLADLAAARRAEPPPDSGRWRVGRWVYYPWSRRLLHVLPPDELHIVRTDRNRHRITRDEQAQLRRARIGIVGLSVGRAVADTLALEGVGGTIKLADFDTLSLSNLNRIQARLEDLGENKCVLAARALAELDPYLDVSILERGITDENLEEFLVGGGKLDLLIEECDDLYEKIRLRQAARRHGIPVIMHTSDGGIVDIERFDREPARPLFHGLVGDIDAASVRALAVRDKVPFVLSILGIDGMSARSKASLVEIGATLSTWPQLGSAVTLGGAVVTDVARRLLLGQLEESGRYFVEPAALVRDGAAATLTPVSFVAEAVPESLADRPVAAAPAPAAAGVSVEQARFLVEQAVLAPSGGNTQPWRFRFDGRALHCRLDPDRSSTFLDVDHAAGHLALGAAVENIVVAAPVAGVDAEVRVGRGDAAVEILLSSARPSASPLFAAIAQRVTNRRRPHVPSPLDVATIEALVAAAAERGGTAQVVRERAALDELGRLVGAADRLRMLSPRMHRELVGELRWSAAEAEKTRDGIDLASLELGALDVAVLRILADPAVPRVLGELGAGEPLGGPARDNFRAASAAVVVTVPESSRQAWIDGGRAVERLWLTACTRGVAGHPQAVLPFFLERLRAHPDTFSADQRRELTALGERFKRVVGTGDTPVMLLRLVVGAPRWTARSLRRPIDDVLELA